MKYYAQVKSTYLVIADDEESAKENVREMIAENLETDEILVYEAEKEILNKSTT